MNNIIDKEIIDWVVSKRPKNKEEISQYFLDSKSIFESLIYLEPWVRNRRILFLGDGDHMSLFLSYFFGVESHIYDIDDDVINSIKELALKLDIDERINIKKYDVRDEWDESIPEFDTFHINPPFSKNNKGQGSIVWLYRCLQKTKINALGICNIPTTRQRKWSSENWLKLQKYLSENNCVIDSISPPFQSYENVIPRRKIHSSIVILYKTSEVKSNLILPKNLYY